MSVHIKKQDYGYDTISAYAELDFSILFNPEFWYEKVLINPKSGALSVRPQGPLYETHINIDLKNHVNAIFLMSVHIKKQDYGYDTKYAYAEFDFSILFNPEFFLWKGTHK